MAETDKPADIEEVLDLVEKLAREMVAERDGLLDIFKLRLEVLCELGNRFDMRMMLLLEAHVQQYAFHVMKMHHVDKQMKEVIHRRQLIYLWRRFFDVPVDALLKLIRRPSWRIGP